jgi:ABC-type nitrate/sulfonate/bicarbonate transport system substrate-binding protein
VSASAPTRDRRTGTTPDGQRRSPRPAGGGAWRRRVRARPSRLLLHLVLMAACQPGQEADVNTTMRPETIEVAPGLTVTSDHSLTGRLRNGQNSFKNSPTPLHILRQTQMLEQMFPNVQVEWRDIFTSMATRDALLSGEIEFTYSTTPVFIQGWSRGAPYKALTPLSRFDGWLMVRPDGPADITEFIGTQLKISPGPGTTPYYAAKALLSEAGADMNALEQNWITLEPSQSSQLLTTDNAQELGAQWDTDRWSVVNRDNGMRNIASFSEAFGFPVATVGVALSDWAESNEPLARAVADAVRDAVTWMRDDPDAAAAELANFAAQSGSNDASPEQYSELFANQLLEPINADAGIRILEQLFQRLDLVEGDLSPEEVEDYYIFPEYAGEQW